MAKRQTVDRGSETLSSIQALLQHYGNLAYGMLEQMFWDDGPDQGLYCFKVQPLSAEPGPLVKSGASIRYSLIAWIGQHSDDTEKASASFRWKLAMARLEQDIESRPDAFTLGDLGLALWLGTISDQQRSKWYLGARRLLLQRLPEEKRRADTMELGWALCGCCHAEDLDRAKVVLESTLDCYNPETRLFSFNRYRPGTAILPSRYGYRHALGSFASQVYPLVGLSEFTMRSQSARVRQVLLDAASTVVNLQGSGGEWRWIYDVRSGEVVQVYPVYSIHQDGMGPMALMAVMHALRNEKFLGAVELSLKQLLDFRDTQGKPIIENGCIWRSINLDVPGPDPADLPFGITPAEFKNVQDRIRPSWIRGSGPDAVAATSEAKTYALREARPVCSGWILYAKALASKPIPPPR
jgi:hypothetical protein